MSQRTFLPISHAGAPFAPVLAPLGTVAEGLIAAAELAGSAALALACRVQAIWLRRRTVRILTSLDDHLLRDIGVRRGDIRAVAERCVIGRTDAAGRVG